MIGTKAIVTSCKASDSSSRVLSNVVENETEEFGIVREASFATECANNALEDP